MNTPTLNCKQGDLAVIVRSYAGNEGKVVRCPRLLGFGHIIVGRGFRVPTFVQEGFKVEYGDKTPHWVWETDTTLPTINPRTGGSHTHNMLHDFQLRPLRGDEGQDETLKWAGKPRKVGV